MTTKDNFPEYKDSTNLTEFLAHKFRTPLTPILSYSDMIISESQNLPFEDIIEMVESINSSAHNLLDSIENMIFILDFESHENYYKTDFYYKFSQKVLNTILSNNYNIRNFNLKIETKIESIILRIPESYFTVLLKIFINSITGISIPSSDISISGFQKQEDYCLQISFQKDPKFSKTKLRFEQLCNANNTFDLHCLQLANRYLDKIGGSINLQNDNSDSSHLEILLPIAP